MTYVLQVLNCFFYLINKHLSDVCNKEKIRLAFVTSTSKNNINSILFSLRKSISQKNFDFIGNSKLVKNLKPNPDIYLLALKKLKLKDFKPVEH